jgi:Protein of unknown function (DUF2934)
MPHSCGRPQSNRHRLRIPYEVTTPTQEEIANLAYSYWEARGSQGGSAQEDWLRAERELVKKHLE